MRKRSFLAGFLLLVGCAAALLLGVYSKPPGGREGGVIIHLINSVNSLNPVTYRGAVDKWLMQYIKSPLYNFDKESMKLEPELAVDMPKMSLDKRRWTISLRRDARWHDGEPVTTRDVVASYKLFKDPDVDADRMRALFVTLTEVKALDDFTFELVYSEPSYFALQNLVDFPLVPAHVVATLEKPSDWNQVKKVIGCGPYKLESWEGNDITVVQNEDWFGPKPDLKRFTYRTILNMTSALRALRRGEIDAMGIPFDQWRNVLCDDKAFLAKFTQLRYHRPVYWFLGWNASRSRFSDKSTRQALTMLFDIQSYLKENWYPGSQQVTGPFFFKSEQYDTSVKLLPYDPKKALELLKEVGWEDSDGDGTLDRNGEKFEFTLLHSRGMAVFEKLAAEVQTAFGNVGIQVTTKSLDTAAEIEQLNQGDFDCVAYGLGTTDPEIDPYQIWHSDAIRGRGSNRYHFSNADADKLIEEASVEFDADKRNALYHHFHRIFYDEQPVMLLFTPQFLFLVNKRIENVESYDLGLTPRIGFEWRIDSTSGASTQK